MMISIKGNLENTLNKKRIEMIDKLLQWFPSIDI